MYERRHQPPVSRGVSLRRLANHLGVAAGIVLGSLGIGMAGDAWLEGLAWANAFMHAAMLLGGMGIVAPPVAVGGKLFVGLYALYSALVFVVASGIILAPAVHRLLHKFHWEEGSTNAE